jgi:hypothetical protein
MRMRRGKESEEEGEWKCKVSGNARRERRQGELGGKDSQEARRVRCKECEACEEVKRE